MTILLKSIFLLTVIYISYKIIGIRKLDKLTIIDLIIIFLITHIYYDTCFNNKSFVLAFISVAALIFLEFTIWIYNKRKKEINVSIYKNRRINLINCFKYNQNVFSFINFLNEHKLDNLKKIDEIVLNENKLCIKDKQNEDILFLITEGSINYNNLKTINKSKDWLINNIDCNIKDVVCSFYKNNYLYVIKEH